MTRDSSPDLRQLSAARAMQMIACYVAWLLLAAAAVFVMLRLMLIIADISFLLDANRYIRGLLDKVGIFVLGLFWLIFVLWSESYLRKGTQLNSLWQRIGKLALGQALLLGLLYALQALFIRFAI